jgi:hypothetical protein
MAVANVVVEDGRLCNAYPSRPVKMRADPDDKTS